MSFVTRSGNQFILDGKRFRFIGINNYPLIHNNPGYTSAQLDTFFAYCVADGIKVVRTWCFDRTPYAGGGSGNVVGNFQYITGTTMNWREATFAQMDLVLDRARAAGIKLSLVMTNGANEFTNDGLKQSYCRWNNTINSTSYGSYNYGDSFHLDADIRARYQAFLSQVFNRTNTVNGRVYKTDDTIAFIEMINEGRFRNEGGSDSGIGTASSYFVTTLKNWYYEMSQYLKNTLSVSQLVSTGGAGQYYDYVRGDPVHNNSTYGLDFNLDHADSTTDYADFHIYPYSDSSFRFSSYGASLISGISRSVTMTASGTTITVALNNHGFSIGEYVDIFDSDQGNYDGTRAVVTTPTTNSFTYTAASAPSSGSANGYVRRITQEGFYQTLKEYATVAHTTLNKPVVVGEYGLVKGNNDTANPVRSYPKYENHKRLFEMLFDQLDFDGIFLWHYTHLFDDNNFNIDPSGAHTGGNVNNNFNDNDSFLRAIIAQKTHLISGRKIPRGLSTSVVI